MRTLLAFLLLLPAAPCSFATILEVPDPYPTIQSAIDAASNGDTVLVAPGTYFENIVFHGKAITVMSSDGAAVTTIDGGQNGSVVRFENGELQGSVLDGFTITNGNGTCAASSGGWDRVWGGGIYCAEMTGPTISNNVITMNTTDSPCEGVDEHRGGGIGLRNGSSAVIVGNVISYNDTDGEATFHRGGGIYCGWDSQVVILDNVIEGNIAAPLDGQGGAIYVHGGTVTIENNTLVDNFAEREGGAILWQTPKAGTLRWNKISGNVAIRGGGGLVLWSYGQGGDAQLLIADNEICGNETSGDGGGICVFQSSAQIRRNTICENTADEGGGLYYLCKDADIPGLLEANEILRNAAGSAGGGVYFEGHRIEVANNIVAHNSCDGSGGAFFVENCDAESPGIVNSTLFGNFAATSGGGICTQSDGPLTIVNSILWANAAPLGPAIHEAGAGAVTGFYCDIEGGWAGEGNLDADPLFVHAGEDDFHLRIGSPCVDAGSADLPGVPPLDYEGDERAVVDIGADELVYEVAARFGTVNAANGPLANVLLVNGAPGDHRRVSRVSIGASVEVTMDPPPAGPTPAPFAAYVWIGEPTESSCTPHPMNLGVMGFPTPLTGGTPQPKRIWNNIGKTQHLGVPDDPSTPAPSTLLERPSGIGRTLVATFQGFILDNGSAASKPASITNAVVLAVE